MRMHSLTLHKETDTVYSGQIIVAHPVSLLARAVM